MTMEEKMLDARMIGSDFVALGGKRLRPRLVGEVFVSLKGADDPRLKSLMDAMETLHKATLVHDDIQDNDEERYGEATVWKRHGVGIAIAVGDLMFAQAFELISNSGFDNAGEMLKAASAAMLEICSGQADELTGISDYLTICRRKTGALFALAATLGALAAGVDPAPYREWGETYGTLFQIRDDLADRGESAELRTLEREYAASLAALKVGPFLTGQTHSACLRR